MKDFSKRTILYVDDDAIIRDMMEHILSTHYPTYNLVFAENGLDALDKTEEHHPEVIIVDYYMPYMDGLELSKRILSQNSLSNIIVVSGCLNNETKESFTQLGITTFIDKPINYHHLYRSIDEMIQKQFLGPDSTPAGMA